MDPHELRRRTKQDRETDLVEMAKEYLRGVSQKTMSEIYKLSQTQVCKDIKEIHSRWKTRDPDALQVIKGRELARIDALEKEFWDAWDASKKPREVSLNEKNLLPGTPNRGPDGVETVPTPKER